MSLQLTFWEDARVKDDPEDYDGIVTVHLKSVKQIPGLLARMPARTAAVSLERSAPVMKRDKSGPTNPLNPKHFKFIWKRGQEVPVMIGQPKKCPFCGHEK